MKVIGMASIKWYENRIARFGVVSVIISRSIRGIKDLFFFLYRYINKTSPQAWFGCQNNTMVSKRLVKKFDRFVFYSQYTLIKLEKTVFTCRCCAKKKQLKNTLHLPRDNTFLSHVSSRFHSFQALLLMYHTLRVAAKLTEVNTLSVGAANKERRK